MGWFSNEEVNKMEGMKEVKRNLIDALDSIEEEMEAIRADIEAKKEEKAVAESEIKDFQRQLQNKQTEANRLETAIATVSGKRTRS